MPLPPAFPLWRSSLAASSFHVFLRIRTQCNPSSIAECLEHEVLYRSRSIRIHCVEPALDLRIRRLPLAKGQLLSMPLQALVRTGHWSACQETVRHPFDMASKTG